MRASRFNITAPAADGGRLLFNAASGGLVELDADSLPVVERLLEDPGSARTDEERGYVETLADNGMLVDGDELLELRAARRRRRLSREELSLTIAPTLACNLRCDYCFEATHAGTMSSQTEAALLTWIGRRLGRGRRVSVVWLGGEPLLRLAQIERIQGGIAEIAARSGAEVRPAGIVTNGFLLGGAVAARLAACGVTYGQVTLDGPPESHDQRRVLRGGGPTWDRIVDNLVEASAHLKLTIRVNVDARNVERVGALREELARRGLRLPLSYAQVQEVSGACGSAGACTLEPVGFAAVELALLRSDLGSAGVVPLPSDLGGSVCGADTGNAFTIGPDGALYRCWASLGIEAERTGSIFSDARSGAEEAEHRRYLDREPVEDTTCRECALLAACMGGCPREAIRGQGRACVPARYNLEGLLELRATQGTPSPAREEST